MSSHARPHLAMVRLLLALALPAIAQAQPTPQQPVVAESPAARSCLDEAQVAGTILLHDLQRNTWVAGRAERVDRALLPASTFKILSSMALLEAGVVATKKGVIPWDSVVRDRAETNRDLTLEEAFRLSSLAHFQVGVRRLPPGFLRRFLDDVGYGNRDMTGEPDRFWIDGGLRISPPVAWCLRSLPAEKARSPAPVMMPTHCSGSAAKASRASCISKWAGECRAFITSGRFSVKMVTWPSRSTRICS